MINDRLNCLNFNLKTILFNISLVACKMHVKLMAFEIIMNSQIQLSGNSGSIDAHNNHILIINLRRSGYVTK